MPSFDRCIVLVVDDEPVVLRMVCATLTRYGYDVLSSDSSEKALQMAMEREGEIHLALLDVMMPGMKGPELFDELRLVYPRIAALFMSGFGSERIVEFLPGLNKVHFIGKPFRPRDLVVKVNHILGNEDACELPEEAEVAAT